MIRALTFCFSFLLSLSVAHAQDLIVKHTLGETKVPQSPQRVVVLGIGALDALDSFGIQPVAVTKFAKAPDYLQKYQTDQYASAGSMFEPDYENIYTQKPDLIISGPRNAKHYDELSKIAPTIIFAVDSHMDYWQGVKAQWHQLGRIFNIEKQVNSKIAQLEQNIQKIRTYNQSHPAKALTIMRSGGNLSAFGLKSRFRVLYEDFGFQQAVSTLKASKHGDLISYEFIQEKDPEVIFVLDRDTLVGATQQKTEGFDNAIIRRTQAYQHHKIVFLDINAWYVAIAGVQATEQMLKDIQTIIEI